MKIGSPQAIADARRATRLLATILVASMLEPLALIPSLGSPSRWFILVALFAVAVVSALPVTRRSSATWKHPAVWLVAASAWTLLVSPFGTIPLADFALAFGMLAFVLYGLWFVETFGWKRMEDALFQAVAWLVAISVLHIAFTSQFNTREMGPFAATNELGNVGALAVLLGFFGWSADRRGARVLLVVGTALLFLSDGRVSQLAVVVAVLIGLRAKLPRWALIAPACLAVASLGLLFTTDALDGIGGAVSRSGEANEVTSFTGRRPVWQIAGEAVVDQPLTGIGAGSTADLYETTGSGAADQIYWKVDNAHNLLLQAALNGGVPAAAFLTVAILGFWLRAGRTTAPLRDAVVALILMHGVTEHVVREPDGLTIVLAGAIGSVVIGHARCEVKQVLREDSRTRVVPA